jgi:hypothetical protein
MELNTQKGQGNSKYELKEFIGADQFKDLLRGWLEAMEEGEDLVVNVKGRECKIPKKAFLSGKFRSEYEIDKGEYEYELQLKWT